MTFLKNALTFNLKRQGISLKTNRHLYRMNLDFEKMGGLIPAIIQDNYTQKVLMLGFMNEEAYTKTVETGKVTFFSRTKNRLWTKGEESVNEIIQEVSLLSLTEIAPYLRAVHFVFHAQNNRFLLT